MCDRVAKNASEEMDGKHLPYFQGLGQRMHLACCDWCADYVANLHAMRRGIQGHDAHVQENDARKILGGLSEESKQRIIARLRDEERPGQS